MNLMQQFCVSQLLLFQFSEFRVENVQWQNSETKWMERKLNMDTEKTKWFSYRIPPLFSFRVIQATPLSGSYVINLFLFLNTQSSPSWSLLLKTIYLPWQWWCFGDISTSLGEDPLIFLKLLGWKSSTIPMHEMKNITSLLFDGLF
jgi:hypothetical protein